MRVSSVLLIALTVCILCSSWREVAGCAFEKVLEEEWESFKTVFKKSYASDTEENLRRKIYMENRLRIAAHNKGNSTFTQEMNQFGDMLFHEFSSIYNGFKVDRNTHDIMINKSATFVPPANVLIPKTMDWRKEGAVTPVKNQGQCGSCWSFGVTGALEGQLFRKTGKLVSLSEQQLVDCAGSSYYCFSCGGGYPMGAFDYIRDNKGIDSEDYYPYQGSRMSCRYSSSKKVGTDAGGVSIPSGSERKLQQAVATQGPVVVSIQVQQSFQFYQQGVYYEPSCQSDIQALNHAVLAIGYGREAGTNYWLVKNSWGTQWGDGGYIKMIRNHDNNCGIATAAGYPLV